MKLKSIDPIPLLLSLTKPAAKMFSGLYEGKNPRTNEVIYRTGNRTKSEKNRIFCAYKELHFVGLIKRIKREHYLINPKAFIPEVSNYENVQKLWDSLP